MAFTREAVEQLSSDRSEPAWLHDARLAAWERFEAMPMPDSSRDEDWRRTDISKLDLAAFAPVSSDLHDEPLLLPREPLPGGAIVLTLDEAVRRQPDLVREHLDGNGNKFSALNGALWSGGAFVYVPPDTAVTVPVMAAYDSHASASFPRTFIVVDRGASLVFVEDFRGQPGSRLSSAATHIVVREGAHLAYVSLQERGQGTWHFATEHALVERDARVDVVVAATGSFLSKSYVATSLTGPGGEANLVGLVLTSGQQHIDHQTLQAHLAPHTTSKLLLKSAVKDHSQSVFAGLVRMPREAQQSDAFQEARALLLSEDAKADAIPKLEIVANDVRCTHAGAIGQVDAEQKFYLMSRGIPEEEAERLIVTGFFEPALERIPVDAVRESIRKALAARLDLPGAPEQRQGGTRESHG